MSEIGEERIGEEVLKLHSELEAERSKGFWQRLFGEKSTRMSLRD